ncbi:MAG: hypothetical protein FJ398_19430 [Verrucomicrobia bacterium]|nr:hypothetical protein [Verrucomicrobiota bacterium]
MTVACLVAFSHEPSVRTVAFRALQRPTAESARKQPEGCGPRGLRFKGGAHGFLAVEASQEPGRAALPRSRFSVDEVGPQRRPTIDRIMGHEQVRREQEAPHE